MNVLMTLVGSEDCPECGDTEWMLALPPLWMLMSSDPHELSQAPLESTIFATAAFCSANIGTFRQRAMPRQE